MRAFLVGLVGLILGVSVVAVAQPARKTVSIVSVTGCLREQAAGAWMVVAATEPVASIANAPQKSDIPTTPPEGTRRFRLIGVGQFDLPAHKDRTVVVRGLFIEDQPLSRINVTSVVDAVASCAPGAPK